MGVKMKGFNLILSRALDFDQLAGLKFVPGTSWLHRIHPLIKLELLLGFTGAVFVFTELHQEVLLLSLLVAAYVSSGLGWRYWVRKMRFVIFYTSFIVLVQMLARQQGLPLWQIQLGPWALTIWSGGLLQGLSIAFRFLSLIGVSFLFVATTDPIRLVQGLIQAGLPYRWGYMLITALRFIPGYQDDFNQVRLAIRLKGIRYQGFSFARLMNMLRYLLVPLLSTTINRVDTLSMSMDGRAFGLYSKRSFMNRLPLTKEDISIALVGLIVVIVVNLV